jgi:NADH:ubiquinone oxidoreductase subunit 4 (subunit M)
MTEGHDLLLTVLVVLPIAAGTVLALLPRLPAEPARLLTLLVALATFGLSIALLATDPRGGLTRVIDVPGIAALGVRS